MSPALARRQFQVSVALLAVTLAGVVAGFMTTGVQPRYAEPQIVQLTIRAPEHMDSRMAGIPPKKATRQN